MQAVVFSLPNLILHILRQGVQPGGAVPRSAAGPQGEQPYSGAAGGGVACVSVTILLGTVSVEGSSRAEPPSPHLCWGPKVGGGHEPSFVQEGGGARPVGTWQGQWEPLCP